MENNFTVIIVNDFDYIQGGASKVAIETANALYEKGVNVIFFSAVHKENNYPFKQVYTNQKECLKDGVLGALRGIYNQKVKREFSKLLDECDPKKTIIHVHGWTKALSSVIFKVAYKKKFKITLTLHDYFSKCPNGGFYNYPKNKICTKYPMQLNCMVCNCDSRNYLFKIYRVIRQKVQNRNMKNLTNFISISNFSISKLKPYLPATAKINKINNPIDISKQKIINIKANNTYLYVGRLSPEKGVDIFCEAITDLNKKGIVVGDGSLYNDLKNKYPNIEFAGWQTKENVTKYMRKAKCLIFPSLWYECSPLTILEAQAIGLPCITSDSCAGIEFIKSKNMIFESKNIEDLKKKINKFEKSNYLQYSQKIYKQYWNNPYDEQSYVEKLIKYYKKIMR